MLNYNLERILSNCANVITIILAIPILKNEVEWGCCTRINMLKSRISLVKEIIFVIAALATIVVALFSLGGGHFDNRASADKVAMSSPSSKLLETTNTFQKKTLMEKEDLPIETQRSNSGTTSETSVVPLELSYVRQGDHYADAGNFHVAKEYYQKAIEFYANPPAGKEKIYICNTEAVLLKIASLPGGEKGLSSVFDFYERHKDIINEYAPSSARVIENMLHN